MLEHVSTTFASLISVTKNTLFTVIFLTEQTNSSKYIQPIICRAFIGCFIQLSSFYVIFDRFGSPPDIILTLLVKYLDPTRITRKVYYNNYSKSTLMYAVG